MKKTNIYRGFFYLGGLLVLALGIILNTKAGLGVSPIISVSYSISTILKSNFGNCRQPPLVADEATFDGQSGPY